MNDDIYYFLPKYNEIENTSIDNFNLSINEKKEFIDLKLSKIEEYPMEAGVPLMHQKFLSRFMSSKTPYDELLLFHEMGTGKTCAVINIIETIRNEHTKYKKAFVLTNGPGIIENFKKELVEKCTHNKYKPKNYSKLNDETRVRRTNALIGEFYEFSTFRKFAKRILKAENDASFFKNYSDTIVVIDEVHNIREHKKDKIKIGDKKIKINVYKKINEFLHKITNRKIILMSGTPMVDKSNEIASIMNLILPYKNSIPSSYADFISLNKDELVEKMKGRISYIKTTISNVDKKYNGIPIGKLKYLNVVEDVMGDFQSNLYLKIFDQDLSNDGKNFFYIKSRLASLMVLPSEITKGLDPTKKLIEYIKNKGNDRVNILNQIEKLSSKYRSSIENILGSIERGKLVFVYMDLVNGGGALMFSKLLEQVGISEYKIGMKPSTTTLRYILLTYKTSTEYIKKLIDIFNMKENMRGDYINVIIGSNIIGEGFTFKNIQVVEILTPHWNLAETDQAIFRGYRVGSHKHLVDEGINITYDVFLRVSIPRLEGKPLLKKSCDLKIYEIAEKKDIEIKKIERLIKEISIDCHINYDRNKKDGFDNSRECEYELCNYKCAGSPSAKEALGYIDTSTYDLYYSHEKKNFIYTNIKNIFREKTKVTLSNLKSHFNSLCSELLLLTYLNEIISRNIPIKNKHEIDCYLREKNDIYFLVDTRNVGSDILLSYYTKNQSISNEKSYKEALKNIYIQNVEEIVKKIFSEQNSQFYMDKLKVIHKQKVISLCITRYNTERESTPENIKKLLNEYKSFWKENSEYFILSLAYMSNKKKYDILYMKKNSGASGEWGKADPTITNLFNTSQEEIKKNDLYGIISNDSKLFKLHIKTKTKNKRNNDSIIQVCKTLRKDLLIEEIKKINPIVLKESNEAYGLDISHIIENNQYKISVLSYKTVDLLCLYIKNYLQYTNKIIS